MSHLRDYLCWRQLYVEASWLSDRTNRIDSHFCSWHSPLYSFQHSFPLLHHSFWLRVGFPAQRAAATDASAELRQFQKFKHRKSAGLLLILRISSRRERPYMPCLREAGFPAHELRRPEMRVDYSCLDRPRFAPWLIFISKDWLRTFKLLGRRKIGAARKTKPTATSLDSLSLVRICNLSAESSRAAPVQIVCFIVCQRLFTTWSVTENRI